jgi:transposase
MDMNALFTAALGLVLPWQATDIQFDPAKRRLDIRVDFKPGSTFACPDCAELCKVHDTAEREWRHLNFFEHQCFLKARLPRVSCKAHGVKTVQVPWARPGSGFTLLLEALIVEMARHGLPTAALARLVGEHDTKLWRVLEHYVGQARGRADHSAVTQVGVDETSRAKGHVYITLFVDLMMARVLFIDDGRDHGTVQRFKQDLAAHGGKPEGVTDFSLDMSPAFIKGVREAFPGAELTFDKFHVIKLANEAVDQVRRKEQKTHPELKKSRWWWLKNRTELKEREQEPFEALRTSALATAKAYRYREQLQGLYQQTTREQAQAYFDRWYRSAVRCRLEPVKKLARTLKKHLAGLLRWFESRISNGLLEGFNSLVQAAKARARGYRSAHYMATIVYLLLSKLDFQLPRVLPSSM